MSVPSHDLADDRADDSAGTRQSAQRRADDIRVFRSELARLGAEGVLRLAPAQAEAVDAHHETLLQRLARGFDIDRDPTSRQLSVGMRVASLLGALALAASAWFLYQRFWGGLSTATRVGLLVGAPIATLAIASAIDRRDETGSFTQLVAMLAFTCFVLDLVLLGRIFDITPSDRAMLAWGAFALLLAHAFDQRLMHAAGLLCVLGFLSARTATWGGMYWLDFGDRPENFLPAAAAMFAVPSLVGPSRHDGFDAQYRVLGLLAFFLPVLLLSNAGRMSYLRLDPAVIEGAYQVLGFAGTAAAVWLGVRRGRGHVVNTGATLFVLFLVTKCFDWWWDWMPKYLFFLVLALVAIVALLVMRRLRGAMR
jgi:uncharacterized membrane protein